MERERAKGEAWGHVLQPPHPLQSSAVAQTLRSKQSSWAPHLAKGEMGTQAAGRPPARKPAWRPASVRGRGASPSRTSFRPLPLAGWEGSPWGQVEMCSRPSWGSHRLLRLRAPRGRAARTQDPPGGRLSGLWPQPLPGARRQQLSQRLSGPLTTGSPPGVGVEVPAVSGWQVPREERGRCTGIGPGAIIAAPRIH